MLASGDKQPEKVPCAWKSRRKCRKAYNYLIESEQSSYKAFVRRREECIDEAYNFYNYKQRKGVECCLWPHLYPFTSWCETVLDGRESRMSSKVSFMTKLKSEITDYGLTHELLHFHYDLWLWQSNEVYSKSAPHRQGNSRTGDVPQTESMQGVTFLQTFTRHTKCHYYNSMVLSDKKPNLSGQIQYSSVTPNDGDGLVMNIDIHADNPLKNALFTRLNGIDAPELYTVHFIKTDNLQHVFSKRIGNLNLCTLHLFLHVFNADNAELCEEIPREGFDLPIDVYDCPLKEFWFKFHTTPLAQAHNFITLLENMLSSKPELRKRVMSPFRISTAKETTFLLSLNALLVVTDFCHVFPKILSG
ncbi:hypothetical protein OS493_012327 [Desmophyllum pertusum]|uniref:Uncharacterized protein n=1 Tax=Desmophyllum pertusum TaxID=174260 RepID=A0A9X0D5V8_9CNID|nr:hypothetical protein OS493_012327 [Desmophyllum pertusum]